MKIVKARPTELKAPLAPSDTSFTLRELIDSKGNTVAMSAFGDWGVMVIRQGDTIEMVKFSGITQNADGSATITVATTGRDIDPTSPYAGSAEGEDFQAGAEVVVSNDPLTLSRFANLDLENTFEEQVTFEVAPKSNGTPADDDDLATKGYVDVVGSGGSLSINRIVVSGTAGETVAAGTLIYFDTTDKEWKKADADTAATVENTLLGIAQGAGTDGNPIASGVLLQGLDSNQSGMTAGTLRYASNTAGSISSIAGTYDVVVGIALSATELYFVPRFDKQLTKAQQDALSSIHAGSITMYGGSSAPTGWLLCDGSAVSRSTYSTLFAVVGTTYGTGDGSTTFNLPDLRSSFPLGAGQRTKTFTFQDSDVNTTTDVITVSSNDWLHTGQAVVLSNSGGTLPTGLSAGTYYVVRLSATTVRLATSRASAVVDAEDTSDHVNITAASGGGTHTLTLTLSSRSLGASGGEEAHTITYDELPEIVRSANFSTETGTSSSVVDSVNSEGEYQAHNTMPPFTVINFIIKV